MVLVLVPQHRLAVYPDSHSPAALQDGRTAYAYLLSQGIPASDIVLSGESSGGDFSRGTAAVSGRARRHPALAPRGTPVESPARPDQLALRDRRPPQITGPTYLNSRLLAWALPCANIFLLPSRPDILIFRFRRSAMSSGARCRVSCRRAARRCCVMSMWSSRRRRRGRRGTGWSWWRSETVLLIRLGGGCVVLGSRRRRRMRRRESSEYVKEIR